MKIWRKKRTGGHQENGEKDGSGRRWRRKREKTVMKRDRERKMKMLLSVMLKEKYKGKLR